MPRKPFIAEPRRVNPLLRPFNALVDRAAGHRFVPARLMSWDSRTAFSWVGGSLYWLFPVGRVRRGLGERLLDMVAITTAYAVGSPYCVWDTAESGPTGLSEGELEAIRTGADPAELPSLSPREQLAIRYARLISATPLEFPEDFIAELRSGFDEQEIVVLAALSAEVNRNARLFEALGAPPPGTRTGG